MPENLYPISIIGVFYSTSILINYFFASIYWVIRKFCLFLFSNTLLYLINLETVLFLSLINSFDSHNDWDFSYSILILSNSLSNFYIVILGKQDPIDQCRLQTYSFSIILLFERQFLSLSYTRQAFNMVTNLLMIRCGSL